MARSNGLGTNEQRAKGKGMEQGVREQGAGGFPAF